jgi:hypothetical protein
VSLDEFASSKHSVWQLTEPKGFLAPLYMLGKIIITSTYPLLLTDILSIESGPSWPSHTNFGNTAS